MKELKDNKITYEELGEFINKLSQRDFEDIDIKKLKTYDEIEIDTSLPREERLLQFIMQGGDLFFGKHKNGVVVKRSFINNSYTMQDTIIKTIKRSLEIENG